MAKGVTELFADFKFRVDLSGLKSFEKQLDQIEKRIRRINSMRIKNFNAQGPNGQSSKNSNKAASAADKAAKSTDRATASNRRYASSLATLVSRYDKQAGSLAKVRQDFAAVQAAYRNSEISFEKRNRLLAQMATRYRHIQSAATQASHATEKVGRPGNPYRQGVSAVGAFVPGFGGAFAGMQSYRTYQDIEGVRSALQAVYGDQSEEKFNYLDNTAREYGRSTTTLGANYSRISAAGQQTGMASEDVDKIFESVLASSTVFNLSNDDTKGVLLAIQQMMSKGQIMSEEFKNQLGERLPTAMGAMVKALGLEGQEDATAQVLKMMEAGELGTEVLPKFADALMEISRANGGLARGLERTSTTVGRFSNTLERSNRVFNESGYDAALKSFFGTMDFSLRNLQPLIRGLGESMQYFGLLAEAPIEIFSNLATVGGRVKTAMDEVDPRLKVVAAGFVAMIKPVRWLITRLAVVPAGILALSDLLLMGDSEFWKNWQSFVEQWNSIDGSWIDKLSNPEIFTPLLQAVGEVALAVAGILFMVKKIKGLKKIGKGLGNEKGTTKSTSGGSGKSKGIPGGFFGLGALAAVGVTIGDKVDEVLDKTPLFGEINDITRNSKTPYEYLFGSGKSVVESEQVQKMKDGVAQQSSRDDADALSGAVSNNVLNDFLSNFEDRMEELTSASSNTSRATTQQFSFGDITFNGATTDTSYFAVQFQEQLEESLSSISLNEPDTER